MLYNVSFMLNGVDCANLVDADADMETVKEYFIHEHLNGDKNRFVGIYKFRNVGDSIKRSRNHERIQN